MYKKSIQACMNIFTEKYIYKKNVFGDKYEGL